MCRPQRNGASRAARNATPWREACGRIPDFYHSLSSSTVSQFPSRGHGTWNVPATIKPPPAKPHGQKENEGIDSGNQP